MPRLRSLGVGDLRPEDVGLELFNRSLTTWRRLGAPADLYDEAKAAAAEVAPTGFAFYPDQMRRLLARRHWSWARPEFLTKIGALTLEERTRLDRYPKLYKENPGEHSDRATR